MVPLARRNPLHTTTEGTGQLIRLAASEGHTRIIVGMVLGALSPPLSLSLSVCVCVCGCVCVCACAACVCTCMHVYVCVFLEISCHSIRSSFPSLFSKKFGRW